MPEARQLNSLMKSIYIYIYDWVLKGFLLDQDALLRENVDV